MLALLERMGVDGMMGVAVGSKAADEEVVPAVGTTDMVTGPILA